MTKAVFIFTKDRPSVLKKTIDSIKDVEFDVFVIDDSFIYSKRIKNEGLLRKYKNFTYLGRKEYSTFLRNYKIESKKFKFLLRGLGTEKWNLGFCRNFALLFSKKFGYNSVLFMDDDIIVEDTSVMDLLFNNLITNLFTGAHIHGLVDDSILGHIATDLGISNERMLSGGFMAFNPKKIKHFYLNIYNEDWIWLYLHLKNKKPFQKGVVYQRFNDPLKDYKVKIMFQEYGEIVLDGLLDLKDKSHFNDLKSNIFWERMLFERKEYHEMLLLESSKQKKGEYSRIINTVKLKKFKSENFYDLFKEYYKNSVTFQKLYKRL
jgi:hypothetical protein